VESGEPDCHQIVTMGADSGAFGSSPADVCEKRIPGKFGTYRASSTPSAGLKIPEVAMLLATTLTAAGGI